MNHFAKFLALGTTLAAFASVASATPLLLTAGSSVTTSTTNGAGTPVNNGTVFTESVAVAPGSFTGTLTETVFHDSSSPFTGCGALGCLTFELQFTNTGGNGIEDLTIGGTGTGFAGFSTEVGFVSNTGSGTTGSMTSGRPVTINETTAAAGGTIRFNYTTGSNTTADIGPGGETDILFVQTNAASAAAGFLSVQDSTSASIPGQIAGVPAAVTPEPSSLMMLGSGLVSAAGMMLRRRKIA